MFPEPTSSCVQFPSVTDDVQAHSINHFTPAEHSDKAGMIYRIYRTQLCTAGIGYCGSLAVSWSTLVQFP